MQNQLKYFLLNGYQEYDLGMRGGAVTVKSCPPSYVDTHLHYHQDYNNEPSEIKTFILSGSSTNFDINAGIKYDQVILQSDDFQDSRGKNQINRYVLEIIKYVIDQHPKLEKVVGLSYGAAILIQGLMNGSFENKRNIKYHMIAPPDWGFTKLEKQDSFSVGYSLEILDKLFGYNLSSPPSSAPSSALSSSPNNNYYIYFGEPDRYSPNIYKLIYLLHQQNIIKDNIYIDNYTIYKNVKDNIRKQRTINIPHTKNIYLGTKPFQPNDECGLTHAYIQYHISHQLGLNIKFNELNKAGLYDKSSPTTNSQ